MKKPILITEEEKKEILNLYEGDFYGTLKNMVDNAVNTVKKTENIEKFKGKYETVTTSPTKKTAYVFKTPIEFKEVEKIMSTLGSSYILPKDMGPYKNTFTSGEYWTDEKHGTYNISYYDFKNKDEYNTNSLRKKKLMVIKK